MRRKVLVADDSNTIRSVAESLLRQEGYEVISASDGAKALSLIRASQPDLVLLDSSMPSLDGLQVCQEIKKEEKFKDIPVLVLLSSAELKFQEEFSEMGVLGFILKPFSPREFLDQVNAALKEEKVFPPSGETVEAVSLDTEKLEQKSKFGKTAHDFKWFIQEMKKEAPLESSAGTEPKDQRGSTEEMGPIEQDFKIEEVGTSKIGYERFISEFKKEMEHLDIEGVEPKEIKEKVERIPSQSTEVKKEQDLTLLVDKFIRSFSSTLASEIAKKIDKKQIEEILKEKIKELSS